MRRFAMTRPITIRTPERVRIAPHVGVGQHDVRPCEVESRALEFQMRLKPVCQAFELFRRDQLVLRRANDRCDARVGARFVFPVGSTVTTNRADLGTEVGCNVSKEVSLGADNNLGECVFMIPCFHDIRITPMAHWDLIIM
jgi:hypothetical protein